MRKHQASLFARRGAPLSGVDVLTPSLLNIFSRRRSHQNSQPAQTSLLQAIADTGGVREAPAGRAGDRSYGIATDSSTSAFFGICIHQAPGLSSTLKTGKTLPAVDSRMKFSILAIGPSDKADFAFFFKTQGCMKKKNAASRCRLSRLRHQSHENSSVFRSRQMPN